MRASVFGTHLAAVAWPFRKSGMTARKKRGTRAAGGGVGQRGSSRPGPWPNVVLRFGRSEAPSGANSKRAKYFLNLPTIKGCASARFSLAAAITTTCHGHVRQRVWQRSGGSGVAVQKIRNDRAKKAWHSSSRWWRETARFVTPGGLGQMWCCTLAGRKRRVARTRNGQNIF